MGITVDVSALQSFAESLRQAAGEGLKNDLRIAMNAVGMEFLRIVQNEIIACNAVVTGLLVNSFGKGGPDNIWEESNGGLTIDVGSNVEYARWVNDGHSKTQAGQASRWVPGQWSGGQFVYAPGSKTGMLLKAGWVPGKHFWDAALRHGAPVFERMMQDAVNQWLAKYF